MRVREDATRRRDGSSGIFSVVEKPDFVVIVPLADDGRLSASPSRPFGD
jgi:ADP-ribose pyrophosphatase